MPPSTRKRRAGDERRVVTGEECDRGGEFLGFGEPAHRDVHQPPRRALGVLGEQFLQQRRVHRSGAQRVDPDALARVLHAELARHRQHAALGRGVGDLRRRRSHHRDERRGVDDRALLRGHHVPQRGLAAEEHRLEVDVLHPVCQASMPVFSMRSSSGGLMPALLNAMSTPPCISAAVSNSCRRRPDPRRRPGRR